MGETCARPTDEDPCLTAASAAHWEMQLEHYAMGLASRLGRMLSSASICFFFK